MRDVNTLNGLHTLRTMLSTKKRSIPRVQSSTYLDLYMLDKEKGRLLKESERLGLRNNIIKKRLEEINAEANKLQEAESAVKINTNKDFSRSVFIRKNGANKEWKKMSLNY